MATPNGADVSGERLQRFVDAHNAIVDLTLEFDKLMADNRQAKIADEDLFEQRDRLKKKAAELAAQAVDARGRLLKEELATLRFRKYTSRLPDAEALLEELRDPSKEPQRLYKIANPDAFPYDLPDAPDVHPGHSIWLEYEKLGARFPGSVSRLGRFGLRLSWGYFVAVIGLVLSYLLAKSCS